MVDGVPIYSSVSNAYGLDMVGLYGLQRVDIARGAGASLTAPESLAGSVNLVTLAPTRNSATLEGDGGSYGYQRGALYATHLLSGGALSVSGSYQRQDSVDETGGAISQFTGYNRNTAGLGLFLDDFGGFRVKARLDHLEEQRMGGPLGRDYYGVIANQSGNPFDFRAGPNGSPIANGWVNPSGGTVIYNDGAFGLAQIIFTQRDQLVATAEKSVGAGQLRLALGAAVHAQDSWYGDDSDYFGRQHQDYLEASYQQAWGANVVTAGVDYRYEDLHSLSYSPNTNPLPPPKVDADAYSYETPGVFGQIYRSFFDERLETTASLRLDDNNVYGQLSTPRLNLLWHHDDETSSRLAWGQGYRLPTSYFEQDHGILQATEVNRSQAQAEISQNLSYAWSYAGDRLDLTATLNHTEIDHMALFVPDPNNPGGLLLQPAPSAYGVDNADVQGSWQFSARNALTLALERYIYRFNPTDFQGSLFSRPDYRFSVALDHNQGPWNYQVKATYTGPQDLAAFYDYADYPRYNLDGTPEIATSPGYWTVDAHSNYQINRSLSAFVGVTNLFDYVQARVDNPLWVDGQGNLNTTQIWGPSLGRAWSVGLKLLF